MAVRIEKILCTVLREAHRRQVEEVMETLEEGAGGVLRVSRILFTAPLPLSGAESSVRSRNR
jgi:hypothetical protein